MEDFLREGRLNPAIIPTQLGFNKVFAVWIIEDDHPFTTGQTDGIHRPFQYMGSRFLLPSDTTVRNALTRIHTEMFDNLNFSFPLPACKIEDRGVDRCMVHGVTFAGTIASWVTEEWELVERVIDFHPIGDKEHQGEYAAAGLASRLSRLQILEKMTSIMLLQMMFSYARCRAYSGRIFDIQFTPDNSQIRCLAHVAEDPAIDDYYLVNKDLPFHYDPDDDPEVMALEMEKFTKEHDATTEEDSDVQLMTSLGPEFEKLSALGKLRATTIKICSSPQCHKRLKATSKKTAAHHQGSCSAR
ncbi:hypothetical protein K438DRAFT_1976453 [Mycena galopus ATCC 62051]|nr:hypothetical protein K438DRAFT_1976453 [Mycena galopus ATCC 62051]